MQNNLKKAREVYFKYFSLQRMACTKATVQKQVMMGMPLMTPSYSRKGIRKKMGKKDGKGKTTHIGVKHLEKIRPFTAAKPLQGR